MKRKLIDDYRKEVKELKQAGLTNKEIGERLGFSENAIFMYCSYWGFKKYHPVLDRKQEIRKLLDSGYNLKQVAQELGLNQATLYYHAKLGRI